MDKGDWCRYKMWDIECDNINRIYSSIMGARNYTPIKVVGGKAYGGLVTKYGWSYHTDNAINYILLEDK